MSRDAIAIRYAEAAFEAATEAKDVETALEQLLLLGELLREHAEFRQLLFNPDVDPEQKLEILDRMFKSGGSESVRAFLQTVITRGRAESLPGIIEAFQAEVDRDQGRLRVLVRSAHPVSEAAMKRLRATLEHRERKDVVVTTAVDPSLIGGVQVLLDDRMLDASVRRRVADLRQALTTLRV